MRNIACLSFTARGGELAKRLCAALGGEAANLRKDPAISLSGWTAANFPVREALVYVGAVGIAVRAIAPYLRDKTRDPAVVAVDERGRFVIPLVSGHLGGANDFAREIAALTGGTAVITTATDINGVFAVDEWAKRQNCAVVRPQRIKTVSGKLLAGQAVTVRSAYPIDGTPPEGVEWTSGTADVVADIRRPEDFDQRESLALIPRILILGVGCKRGTNRETLEERFAALCERERLWPEAFCAAASIDWKAEEPGLLAFCAAHGWKLSVYPAEALRRVAGTFTASGFVEQQTGVDNVCERAAALCGGGGAEILIVKKTAGAGVTIAAAQKPYRMDWRWQYGDIVCSGNRTGESGISDR